MANKEVQEMINDVGLCLAGSAYGTELTVDADSLAYQLRRKGYRRADIVRKETAKAILKEVGNKYVSDYEGNSMQIKKLPWFRRLLIDYGIDNG